MANIGAAPLDVTTPVGQVRLLLGDTDATDITNGRGTYLWYSDSELTGLISLYAGNVFRTTVRILRVIAGSESMKLKKWTSADLAVDGSVITLALNALADSIEADDRYGVTMDAAEYVQVLATGGRDHFAQGARTQDEMMWLFRRGWYSAVIPDIYSMQDFIADTPHHDHFDETSGLI